MRSYVSFICFVFHVLQILPIGLTLGRDKNGGDELRFEILISKQSSYFRASTASTLNSVFYVTLLAL